MTGTAHPTLIVLDVNETLSDMSPLASAFEEVGAPRAAAPLWFATTLRDGFALGMAGQNAPFLDLAKDVLRTVLAPYVADEQQRDAAVESVLGAFGALDTHPDVPDALRDLREAGIRLVTLSNGSARVAESLLGRAGLTDTVEQMLSVEDAPAWKPDPRAYGYALHRTGVAAERAMLVATHPWDVDGAARAGLRTAWVNRSGIATPRRSGPRTSRCRASPTCRWRSRPADEHRLRLRGARDGAPGVVDQLGLDHDRGAALVHQASGGRDHALAGAPDEDGARRDGAGAGALGQVEEGHGAADRVRQRHQRAAVQRSAGVVSRSCQRTVPTTVCGSAETSSRPRVVPSGISVLRASVVSSMPQFYRLARFAGT